ncbi:hypothetical protein [Corynebacterium matruchotii]|nr:hypothetical protein [Corynebacterium matruchotii]
MTRWQQRSGAAGHAPCGLGLGPPADSTDTGAATSRPRPPRRKAT